MAPASWSNRCPRLWRFRMPRPRLDKLARWLDRPEWVEIFGEWLELHSGVACDDAGIDHETLINMIGDAGFMQIWSCAFEDFLSFHDDDGLGFLDDYLKRRGFGESEGNRAYMRAIAASIMSLYEVTQVTAGESFVAKDLVRSGAPIHFFDVRASGGLRPRDKVAVRHVHLMGKDMITGALLYFHPARADQLLIGLEQALASPELFDEIDQLAPSTGDDHLRRLAPLFTNAWVAQTLERRASPLPNLTNSDGDALIFVRLSYPLLRGVAPAAVRARLNQATELRRQPKGFWIWAGDPVTDEMIQSTTIIVGATEDGRESLGIVQLRGRTVILEVNSLERAGKQGDVLLRMLSELVAEPDQEIIDLTEEDDD